MNDALKPNLSAFILAGGKSSRMGQNKALIKVNELEMILHSLNLAGKFTPLLHISGDKEEYKTFGHPIIKDQINEIGPLGGIHSCLVHSKTTFNLFLPCDVPYLSESVIQNLLNTIEDSDYQAVIAKGSKGKEPLIIILNKNTLAILQSQIILGDYKIQHFLANINTMEVDMSQAEIENPQLFNNLNSPLDLPQ